MHRYRTHTCGELRAEQVSQQVRLSGWAFRKRDHGSLLFIDLRDHYGITQVVFHPDRDFFAAAQKIRLETVITITGEVVPRDPEMVNPNLATGEIEIVVNELTVLSAAEQLPLYLAGEEENPEHLRLRYRFLDLRGSRLHANIMLRSRVIASIRRRMVEHGFSEFQTPILTSSSPEGARDYLVPSRMHPGKFYALPQAPQQFKQLLMIGGFDRYFQIAPCFRDEDARADRSPGEFYQLDLEMSFVTQDDVFEVVEDLLHGVFTEFSDWTVTDTPFPRFPYAEAMLKYGTDKPDLRIPIEIRDVTEMFRSSEFNAFRTVVEQGGVVRVIPAKGIAARPRAWFDRMVAFAQSIGSKGLAYLVWTDERVKGPLAKFMTDAERAALAEQCGIQAGDVAFFVCAKEAEANAIAGQVRLKLGAELDLVKDGSYRLCWVTDFPMFEVDEQTRQITFSHNPFSMPQGGLAALNEQDPLQVLGYQYDIVCNGVELSSGAIRNHEPAIMYRAFEIAGYSKEEVDARFGGMISAFRYGAPPHGGIAPGIDRIVMLLANEPNIREVVAFPMNGQAQDLMMGAPSEVSARQLRELHLRLALPKKKGEDTPG